MFSLKEKCFKDIAKNLKLTNYSYLKKKHKVKCAHKI